MLNENSSKKEIEQTFKNAHRVMDDLCLAYFGMTWDDYIRYLGERTQGEAKKECQK